MSIRWAFIGAALALKARSDLKPGEYAFQKNASLRDVIGTIVEGKVVQHTITIPEGLTSEQIVARLSDNDDFRRQRARMPREGTLLPETYKFPRGTTARAGDPAHAADAEARAGGNLGAPQSRHPGQVAGATGDAGLHHREGNRPGRRAQPRRRRLHQPPAAEDQAAVRSDHHLWPGRRQGHAGPADQALGNHPAVALQHLCDRRPCRRGRSPIPAAPRWKPPPIRRARATCSSSPTAPVATPSPKPTTRTRRASQNCARWKSRSRTTPSSRPRKRSRCRRRCGAAGRCQSDRHRNKAGRAEEARARPPAAPAQAPARQGAAQSTTAPPVVQR